MRFFVLFLWAAFLPLSALGKNPEFRKEERLELLAPAAVSGVEIRTGKKIEVKIGEAKKATVLLFLSAVCPCTNGSLRQIKELSAKYRALGFDFYGVNLDYQSKLSDLKEFHAEANLGFPVIRDKDLAIAKGFQVELMGESAVILPSGRLAYRGGIKDEADGFLLFDALADLAEGRAVKVAKGAGMGCFLRYPGKSGANKP